mmetsp:Transcript_19432/g.34645  ORF Transcript_19432/g.34645 Transcript_19432/m.34645 type:complete len:213 (+) Transcript_19432:139-777(+)
MGDSAAASNSGLAAGPKAGKGSGGFALNKVENKYGSSAGANSGDFHVFRKHRRTEIERQRSMEDAAVAVEKQEQFAKQLKENEDRAKAKTSKNALKRKRQKERQKAAKAAKVNTQNDDSLSLKAKQAEASTISTPTAPQATSDKEGSKSPSTDHASRSATLKPDVLPSVAPAAPEPSSASAVNQFANDGSFLDGFRALNEFTKTSQTSSKAT